MKAGFFLPKNLVRRPFAGLALAALAFWGSAGWAADGRVADTSSAAAVWADMQESSLTREEIPLIVKGTSGRVTFGAEKEGSSYLITRVMGPNAGLFKSFVSGLAAEKQRDFLRNFFNQWVAGGIRELPRDREGNLIKFPMREFENVDWQRMQLPELTKKLDSWLEKTGNSPFSFLTRSARRDLFKGSLAGLGGTGIGADRKYSEWVPLRGQAEKFIENAHNTGKGWEINFKPQATYAEDETMIDWFRASLKNAGELFDAPGHQRIVFPKRLGGEATDPGKMAEVYRNLQAYILLRSQEGKSGVEAADYKGMSPEETLERSHNTSRDILRLEENRFGQDTFAVEIRAGTKSAETRRFAKQAILSRYVSNDYSGLASISDYQLIPTESPEAEKIAVRYGITQKSAESFLEKINSAKNYKGNAMNLEQVPALWSWENVPYLSPAKRAQLRELTRIFITSIADWKAPTYQDMQSALASWAKSANLSNDIANYLRPKPAASSQELGKLLEFRPARAGPVDVNKIDLGLEYTARYPIRSRSVLTDEVLPDGRRGWLEVQYDLSPEERKKTLSDIAIKIGKNLDPGSNPVPELQGLGNHGHSLETAYEFQDKKQRKWRVEWDGIGRDYSPNGTIIPESQRGGHVEVVSPKFVPEANDLLALQKAFADSSAIPSVAMGGGHINVDLAPFEGKPKQLARFLSLVNENRGIISMLFQDPRRLRSAEPIEISDKLAKALAGFDGTEKELKQLLYNERYFNSRVGRKSRYIQLDLSAYFQDVIPEEFIHQDFDIKNDLWHRNFDVDPKIRKAEFRLFNAPRTAEEGALQIKFVRALLNEALNGSGPVSGKVADVNYNKYLEDPKMALQELRDLCDRLGLKFEEYRPLFVDSMSTARAVLQSNIYKSFEQQMERTPRVEGWKQAVEPRSASAGIDSEGRIWKGADSVPEAREIVAANQESRVVAERLREGLDAENPRPGVLRRGPAEKNWIETKGMQDLAELHPVDQLRVIFANSKNGRVGSEGTNAIAALREASSIEDAIANLLLSPDEKLQDWAAKLIKKEEPVAIAAALRSRNPKVRAVAYDLIEGKTTAEYLSFLNSELTGSRFPEVTRDYFEHVVRRLPKRIPEALKAETGSFILNILNSRQPGPDQLSAVVGLVKKGMITTQDLIEVVDNGSPESKVFALKLAARQNDGPLMGAVSHLTSPNPELRKTAQEIFAKWIKALQSPNAETRNAVYAKMKDFLKYDVAAFARLVLEGKILESTSAEAKLKAVEVLGKHPIYDEELGKRLFQSITNHVDLDKPELARAVAALVKINGPYIWGEKSEGLFANKNYVVRAALFNEFYSPVQDTLVFRGLEDQDARVRRAAEAYMRRWSNSLAFDGDYMAEIGLNRMAKLPVAQQLRVFNDQNLFTKKSTGLSPIVKKATSLLSNPEVTPQMQRKWARDLASLIAKGGEPALSESARAEVIKQSELFFESLTDPRARAALKALAPLRKDDLRELKAIAKKAAADPACAAFFARISH